MKKQWQNTHTLAFQHINSAHREKNREQWNLRKSEHERNHEIKSKQSEVKERWENWSQNIHQIRRTEQNKKQWWWWWRRTSNRFWNIHSNITITMLAKYGNQSHWQRVKERRTKNKATVTWYTIQVIEWIFANSDTSTYHKLCNQSQDRAWRQKKKNREKDSMKSFAFKFNCQNVYRFR